MISTQHDWYKDAIFYEVNIRAFCDTSGDGNGDILGLIKKLDYIKGLGIDCIWILPHYPSPLEDGGYDIADYYAIHPDYGSLEDFKLLVQETHARGLKIIVDLVLNHTSDQHPWFVQSRQSKQSPFRNYYVWSDSDQVFKDARIIFIDTETSNWAWDEDTQQYYWHRFYTSQPDLNFDNPEVQQEMLNVVKFWCELGIDGFRADATPYLFEREGTSCENLPETHQYLQKLRRFLDEHYPGRLILSEANQWPEDVREYFSDGDEVHMNFHFPLMPRVFMALKRGDVTPIKEILAKTPEIPDSCQWCTFLRNHDELTLEMVTGEERQWMWQEYAPEPRMRLNLGIRRRLAPLLENDKQKIQLAFSLLMTLPGSPVIYYGDEIGMGDNIWLQDRDGVRTPMQWDNIKNAGFSEASEATLYSPVIDDQMYGYQAVNVRDQAGAPDSLLASIKKMIAKRKQHPALGRGTFRWANEIENLSLAAFWREYQNSRLLIIHNLTAKSQEVDLTNLAKKDGQFISIISQERISEPQLTIPPHHFLWLDCS